VLRALVGHDDGVDDLVHLGILRERVEGGDGVRGAVKRGNAHGDLLVTGVVCGLAGRPPLGGLNGAVGFGSDVEPQPAAVLERGEGQLELVGGVCYELAAQANARAVDLRAVALHASRALHLNFQNHAVQHRPAAPVGGRERTEVRLKAYFLACRNGETEAVAPATPALF